MVDFGYAFSVILVLCIGIVCILGTVKLFLAACDYVDRIQMKKIGEHDRYEKLRDYAASRLKKSLCSPYTGEWYEDFSEKALDILVGDPIDFPKGSEGYQKRMDRLYDMLTK